MRGQQRERVQTAPSSTAVAGAAWLRGPACPASQPTSGGLLPGQLLGQPAFSAGRSCNLAVRHPPNRPCRAIPFQELTLHRRIGQGAFGRVYLATWHQTPCAVKVLLARPVLDEPGGLAGALAAASPLVARLQGEARLMFALRHPNCVQLMVSGPTGGLGSGGAASQQLA